MGKSLRTGTVSYSSLFLQKEVNPVPGTKVNPDNSLLLGKVISGNSKPGTLLDIRKGPG